MCGGDLAFGSVISDVCLAFGSVIDQRFAWRLVASLIRGLLGVWWRSGVW